MLPPGRDGSLAWRHEWTASKWLSCCCHDSCWPCVSSSPHWVRRTGFDIVRGRLGADRQRAAQPHHRRRRLLPGDRRLQPDDRQGSDFGRRLRLRANRIHFHGLQRCRYVAIAGGHGQDGGDWACRLREKWRKNRDAAQTVTLRCRVCRAPGGSVQAGASDSRSAPPVPRPVLGSGSRPAPSCEGVRWGGAAWRQCQPLAGLIQGLAVARTLLFAVGEQW